MTQKKSPTKKKSAPAKKAADKKRKSSPESLAKSSKTDKKRRRIYEIELVILISATIIYILALHTDSVGMLGHWLKVGSFGLFSKGGLLLPYAILAMVFLNLNPVFEEKRKRLTMGIATIFVSLNLMVAITRFAAIREQFDGIRLKYLTLEGLSASFQSGGSFESSGLVNDGLSLFLYSILGKYGLLIISLTLLLIGVILVAQIRFNRAEKKGMPKKRIRKEPSEPVVNFAVPSAPLDREPIRESATKEPVKPAQEKEIKIFSYNDFNPDKEKPEDDKKIESEISKNVQAKYENYTKPKLTLLKKPTFQPDPMNKTEVIHKAEVLERTLAHFGVEAKVMEINKGPTITRYEIQPKPGTKISKIANLSDDLALNLAVSQVRVAPVPGKVAVGIEVPNEENAMVKIREILESPEFKKSQSKLSFALGKNISGQAVVADLSEMPHLLIAGATGSGKSVCVNGIITSILFNATPDEVKLLMIDPKVVELNVYNGIPHLILPVVTEPKKASVALGWAVSEMTRRYDLFAESQVRDLENYNRKFADSRLPQIVVIIDELSDLMMVSPQQVEEAIARLAQMARAAGIHLIVATQRPSVDVITGLIKANITSRIAFSVSAQVDSRTILDTGGAEKLLGKGDMLFSPVGAPKPIRLQGAYISEEEVEKVVEHIKAQSGDVIYDEKILEQAESVELSMDQDDLIPQVIRFIANEKQVSVSMLQRKFKIGYNRSARIVEQLEENGLIGPKNGSKPRDVVMTIEQLEDYL